MCLSRAMVSDFTTAEFSEAAERRMRTKELTPGEARAAFDAWTTRATERVTTTAADVATAKAYVRRLDLSLRTSDAVKIAIAGRLDAELATFDAGMAANAAAIGVTIAQV